MRRLFIALVVTLWTPAAVEAGQWGMQWGTMIWGPEAAPPPGPPAIPTLDPWGMAFLAVALGAMAWKLLRSPAASSPLG